MLVSENAKICVSPMQNPMGPCVGHVHFLFFVCRFHLRWVADANAVFSGIWALEIPLKKAHENNIVIEMTRSQEIKG